MAGEQGLRWWPLPEWLAGSSAVWFVVLNVVVGAIVVLSSRAGTSSSPRRGGGVTPRGSSSAVLQRLRSSFSIFSFPSLGFQTAPLDQPAEPQTPPRKPLAAPEMRDAYDAEPAAPETEGEEEEYDANSMSMDEAYAWALAGRPPTEEEEEAGWSDVNAKAEEFIREFKDDLRQQRLDSIYNNTQMLKRPAPASAGDMRQQRLDSIYNYTQMLKRLAAPADDMRKQRLESMSNYTSMLKSRAAALAAGRQ